MADLKIWGGRALYVDIRDMNDRAAQLRTVVVAYTKKGAMRLLAMSRHEFDSMWSETGATAELNLKKHGESVWRRVGKRDRSRRWVSTPFASTVDRTKRICGTVTTRSAKTVSRASAPFVWRTSGWSRRDE